MPGPTQSSPPVGSSDGSCRQVRGLRGSPNLPVRLRPLMKAQGFSAVSVDAFPIVNTSRTLGDFSTDMLEQFAQYAQEQGAVSTTEAEAWLDDLHAKGEDGLYFFV